NPKPRYGQVSAEEWTEMAKLTLSLPVHVYFFDKCHAVDLVQSRSAGEYLFQGRFTQTGQALGLSRPANLRSRPALNDHFANVVAQVQQFVNRRTAAVTSVVTGIAAHIHVKTAAAMLFRA